jgi:hypothetical protein
MGASAEFKRDGWRIILGVGALVAMLSAATALAQGNDVEIKPFGQLDSGGSVAVRYIYDSDERSSTSLDKTSEELTTWEQEVWYWTKNYVYHPGFLNTEFAIGPKLIQQRYNADAGSNSTNDGFLGYRARLNFFELKKYTFSVYGGRSHPSVSTGLVGRYQTETNDYGVTALLRGIGRSSLRADFNHRDVEGSGFDTTIDEDIDEGSIQYDLTYGSGGSVTLEHRQIRRDSSSGSAGLPIQRSIQQTDTSSLQTRNNFGTDNRNFITQSLVRIYQQFELPDTSDLDSLQYNLGSRLEHTDSISTSYGLSFSDIDRDDAESSNLGGKAGLSHLVNDVFRYGGQVDYSSSEDPGFARDRTGVLGNFRVFKETRIGVFSVNGSARFDRTDQEAEVDLVSVFDERLELIGTTPVSLANEFVVQDSIIVRNVANTQVFIEGIDYRLVLVGSVTSIQRLVNGNILDGQTVLVDYDYRTSGTAEFDSTMSTIGVSGQFGKYFSASLGYSVSDTEVRSGVLTQPTNDQNVIDFVLRADLPLGRRWSFDGEYRYRDISEGISPSEQNSLRVGASARLFGSARFYVSVGSLQVDQKLSPEDVDQVDGRIGIDGRLFRSMRVAYDASYLRDTGGTLPREQLQHRLNVEWGYRRVRVILRGSLFEEKLDVSDRKTDRILIEFRRMF